MLPALGHIGPEVRSFYSVDDKTCLLAGAEQESPAHNPWSTQGPHPALCSTAPRRFVSFSPQPTPPAARAAGHIERFVRVAHSSQPGAADSFCAPTAGDAVLPLS